MPLGKNVRYRWKTYPSGKKVRLAFAKGTNTVIEVKPKDGKAKRVNVKKGKKKKGKKWGAKGWE